MIGMRATLSYALFLALGASASVPAGADVPAFPPMPSDVSVVSDSSLAVIRGKYIASADPSAIALYRGAPPVGAQPLAAARTGASPLSGVASAGSVTYFGVAMQSTWTVGSGAQAVTESAGLNVGVNASSKSVTIQSWSSGSGQGIPSSSPGGGVTGGSPLANISSGIGQSIQVAGNGSTAANEATLTYGGAPLTEPVAVLNTCGAQCTETAGGNALGVAIVTPRGSITQSIGNGVISQSVQAWGDGNTIVNQLGISVQTRAAGPQPGGGLPTILQTLNGLP